MTQFDVKCFAFPISCGRHSRHNFLASLVTAPSYAGRALTALRVRFQMLTHLQLPFVCPLRGAPNKYVLFDQRSSASSLEYQQFESIFVSKNSYFSTQKYLQKIDSQFYKFVTQIGKVFCYN